MKARMGGRRPDAREKRKIQGFGVLLGGVLLLTLLCLGLGWRVEQALTTRQVRGDLGTRPTHRLSLTHEGQVYRYRGGLTSVLLIGTDLPEGAAPQASARAKEEADFLMLLVFDRERREITPLEIDRDTLADIPQWDAAGQPAGTRRTRICRSYDSGEDDAQSCSATVAAVSGLLQGIDIPLYIAMDYDAIAELNDLLGGVEVTLADDFSHLDGAMRRGATLILRGEQAVFYLQRIRGIGDGTHVNRMARHRNYLPAAAAQLRQRLSEDSRFPGILYDRMQPLWHSNITRGRMINETYAARDYVLRDIVSLAGTHRKLDDGTVVFQAEKAGLMKTVLTLFFEPEENA